MKIAMIGSGAAGSVFASYLRRGGAELFLVDRYKAHMDKVAQDGMTFITPEGECCIHGFCTCASAQELPIMDIVIIMVKATQTDDVMESVMSCVGPETILISLQNGLGNDEILMKYVPADRIMYGSGVIGTELPAPGVCVSKPEAGIQMFFGAVKKSDAADAAGKYLEKCFIDGGCTASFEEDVRPYIWKKAIMNSGYNTVSTVLRLRVGEAMADSYGRGLIEKVWKEGCAVARAAGIIDLWPIIEADTPNLIENLGNYYPSMAQDALIHKRQTEISVLNGAIARYGEKYGVPTPINSALTEIVLAIQGNYNRQYEGKPKS
jgi:2-dehydropantoate 2-reductase